MNLKRYSLLSVKRNFLQKIKSQKKLFIEFSHYLLKNNSKIDAETAYEHFGFGIGMNCDTILDSILSKFLEIHSRYNCDVHYSLTECAAR